MNKIINISLDVVGELNVPLHSGNVRLLGERLVVVPQVVGVDVVQRLLDHLLLVGEPGRDSKLTFLAGKTKNCEKNRFFGAKAEW